MPTYLLGIDIGTSACKAAAFTETGEAVFSSSRSYPVYYPRPGWAEQAPDLWWQGVSGALQALWQAGLRPEQVAGIGVDGQSWSAVAVDRQGEALCNTPIWMDTRAEDICREVEARVGRKRLFEKTGNPLKPSYSTAKILWYRRERPDIYPRIHQILQSNSYIVHRLTGVFSQDRSQGYGLHCFDERTMDWDLSLAEEIGIPLSFLPTVSACSRVVGRVTARAAKETGLLEGTPVVAGGLDAACGALGVGVLHEGETQEQGGQAGGASICIKEYRADERLILSPHVVPGCWLLQGGTTGGGGVMRWIDEQFGEAERHLAAEEGISSMALLDRLAGQIPPGSDGVVFLPYMSGERSPIWNPKAKGVFFGLDFAKTRGHLVRAALEGVAFSLRHNLETAENAGVHADVLRAMGGAANSRLWTQIKADVTGKPVVVPASDTATTLGAAILAGVGVGVYAGFAEAVGLTVHPRRRHEPDAACREIYDKNYRLYRRLYEDLRGLMDEAAG